MTKQEITLQVREITISQVEEFLLKVAPVYTSPFYTHRVKNSKGVATIAIYEKVADKETKVATISRDVDGSPLRIVTTMRVRATELINEKEEYMIFNFVSSHNELVDQMTKSANLYGTKFKPDSLEMWVSGEWVVYDDQFLA